MSAAHASAHHRQVRALVVAFGVGSLVTVILATRLSSSVE